MTRANLLMAAAALTLGSLGSAEPVPALAGTATGTIAVSATVITLCTIVTLPLAFGNYTSTTVSDASSNITVACTSGVPYTVGLSVGNGSGASVATRKMTSGANTLNYGLFSDPGYATPWGPTVGTNTVAGTGNGVAQILPVYGQIPSGQASPTGLYGDLVTATLNF
jgi:spore coat protein U-like protein